MRRLLTIGAMAIGLLVGGCGNTKVRAYCGYTHDFSTCAYDTIASCRAAMRGDAGFCAPNPQYPPRPH